MFNAVHAVTFVLFWSCLHFSDVLNKIVSKFTNLYIIDTLLFLIFIHSQFQRRYEPAKQPHSDQNKIGHDKAPGKTAHSIGELDPQLDPVSVQPSTFDHCNTIKMSNIISRKDACQQLANEASDRMDSEDIQGVIRFQPVFEMYSEIAADTLKDGETLAHLVVIKIIGQRREYDSKESRRSGSGVENMLLSSECTYQHIYQKQLLPILEHSLTQA